MHFYTDSPCCAPSTSPRKEEFSWFFIFVYSPAEKARSQAQITLLYPSVKPQKPRPCWSRESRKIIRALSMLLPCKLGSTSAETSSKRGADGDSARAPRA